MGAGFGNLTFKHPLYVRRVLTMSTGTRRSVRDDLTSTPQRCRSRCVIRLGCTCLHNRKGQGHKEVVEGQTGLDVVYYVSSRHLSRARRALRRVWPKTSTLLACVRWGKRKTTALAM